MLIAMTISATVRPPELHTKQGLSVSDAAVTTDAAITPCTATSTCKHWSCSAHPFEAICHQLCCFHYTPRIRHSGPEWCSSAVVAAGVPEERLLHRRHHLTLPRSSSHSRRHLLVHRNAAGRQGRHSLQVNACRGQAVDQFDCRAGIAARAGCAASAADSVCWRCCECGCCCCC